MMTRKQLWALMDTLPSFNPSWSVARNVAWQAWQDAAKAGSSDATRLYAAFIATFA